MGLSISLSISLLCFCLSIGLFIVVSVGLSIAHSIYLSICLSICLSIGLSINLFIVSSSVAQIFIRMELHDFPLVHSAHFLLRSVHMYAEHSMRNLADLGFITAQLHVFFWFRSRTSSAPSSAAPSSAPWQCLVWRVSDIFKE